MASSSDGKSKKTRAEQQKRRRARRRKRQGRKLMRDALSMTAANAEEIQHLDPIHALQFVLNRTYAWLQIAIAEVDKLPEDEFWRDSPMGRIENEWVRLEADLRKDVAYLSARMLELDMEDRRAQAVELIAGTIAPVLEGVLDDLDLTKKQQARAKKVVGKHLKLLEGDGSESDAES